MIKKSSLFFLIGLIVTSCANDSSGDFPNPIPQEVNYTDHIQEIMINNCLVCHNSDPNPIAPFPLETYDEVREETENGNLLFRIQLPPGDRLIMPQSGKMSQTNIDIIIKWADQGYLEN